MNNNDLRAKIQDVLDQREQNMMERKKHTITEYVDAIDAISFSKIKQILAATHLEEFLGTLLDYKQKGYTYLKQISFYTRQVQVTLITGDTNSFTTPNYDLQANESISEITKQIVEIFYSHENNDE